MTSIRFTGGTIHTLAEGAGPAAELVVTGDRVAGGPAADAVVADLAGACVLPGFTDSHVHFPTWALAQRQVGLQGCSSLEAALERVADAARDVPAGGWLRGYGWRDAEWVGDTAPTAADLERAAPGVKVALISKDYHSLWASPAALAEATGPLERPGGVVERFANGTPTGVLRETSAWAFRDEVSAATPEEHLDAMRDGVRLANARGVVAVHDKDGWLDALTLWGRLRAEDKLTLRVWQSVPFDRVDALATLGLPHGFGDEFLRVGYVKAFMDGALGSGTEHRLDGSGVEILDADGLEAIIRAAAAAGFPVGVHAIGDRANRQALDAFEASRDAWAPQGLRPRIEHAQLLHPDDLGRFAALGVAASVQFSHAPSDRDMADAAWGATGSLGYGYGSLLAAGTVLANGSDAPVEELDPLAGIAAGVRRTIDDRPAWTPDECITVEQAVHATCVAPAWLEGAEGWRGTLAAGMAADLVVLDRDPFACPADQLPDVRVLGTMLAGRWVFGGVSGPA